MKAAVVDSRIIDLFTEFNIEKEIFEKENIEFEVLNITGPEDYVRLCKDTDALLLIGLKTPKEVIRQLPKCKVIVRYGVGYDAVDVDSCSEAGIAVCNIPDAGTNEVASHAFALALDCIRKISYYDRQIRKGLWHPGSGYVIHRYSQYTFGFCGFGNIGRVTAKLTEVLGCRRIAYDPYVDDEIFKLSGVTRVSLDELLEQADVISIHIPLSKETHHLFSSDKFRKMKPGMVVINTSRGGIINQEDLLDAIDKGIVSAAGLDVNEHEPINDLNDRILQYETVVITPHSASESEEYFRTVQERAALTAIAVLKGDLPDNVINKAAIRKN